jgi:hypothetical protein
MGYVDPDGAAHEVILRRPGFADSDMRERAVWTTVLAGVAASPPRAAGGHCPMFVTRFTATARIPVPKR